MGKQGRESLSESPYPHVPQGEEGVITTQRQARAGSSIPWSRFVLAQNGHFWADLHVFWSWFVLVGKLRWMFQFTNRV